MERLTVGILAIILGYIPGVSQAQTAFDPPCGSGLVCDALGVTFPAMCRPTGNGVPHALCGAPGDAPCQFGSQCTSIPIGVIGLDLMVCRNSGDGSLSAFCGNLGDASCQQGLACGGVTCRTAGDGTVGADCGGVGDTTCQGGTLCAPTGGFFKTCRPVGDGSVGAGCGQPGDAACQTGELCDDLGLGEIACRPVGDGSVGADCNQPGDAACQAGSLCDDVGFGLQICRPVGDGSVDAGCGQPADAPCQAQTVCDLSIIGGSRNCRGPGDGTSGAPCAYQDQLRTAAPLLDVGGSSAAVVTLLLAGLFGLRRQSARAGKILQAMRDPVVALDGKNTKDRE